MLVTPFALVTSVLSSTSDDLSSWWRWMVVNLASLAAAAGVVGAARLVVRRRRPRLVPLTVVVTVGAMVGLCKGVTTTLFAVAFGLLPDAAGDVVGRGLNTMVIGALVVPGVAALAAARDRWHQEQDLLMVELVRRTLDGGSHHHTPYRQQLRTAVDTTASRLVDAPPEVAAAELRRLVDDTLRPLSVEVMRDASPPPLSSGRDLMRFAVMSEPWSTKTVVTVFSVTVWLLVARYQDAWSATRHTLAVGLTVWLVVFVVSMARRRWRRWSPMWLVATAVASGVVQHPVGQAAVGEVEALSHIGITVTTALWLIELLVAIAMLTAARRERDAIRSQLIDLMGPLGVRAAIAHGVRAIEGREFGFFIHGHLQNQLIAAAQRLERVVDTAAADDTLREVLALLDETTRVGPPNASLGEALSAVVDRWRGLAVIDIAELVDVNDPQLRERVMHIVVEAVTNAVRHGAASQIEVAVSTHPESGITVKVTDDGFGPRNGPSGTGSRYLDVVTHHCWSLEAHPTGGSILTAHLTGVMS
jgi:signal transduction histidine kinase